MSFFGIIVVFYSTLYPCIDIPCLPVFDISKPIAQSHVVAQLTVATINILNNLTHWSSCRLQSSPLALGQLILVLISHALCQNFSYEVVNTFTPHQVWVSLVANNHFMPHAKYNRQQQHQQNVGSGAQACSECDNDISFSLSVTRWYCFKWLN